MPDSFRRRETDAEPPVLSAQLRVDTMGMPPARDFAWDSATWKPLPLAASGVPLISRAIPIQGGVDDKTREPGYPGPFQSAPLGSAVGNGPRLVMANRKCTIRRSRLSTA